MSVLSDIFMRGKLQIGFVSFYKNIDYMEVERDSFSFCMGFRLLINGFIINQEVIEVIQESGQDKILSLEKW